jgi:hypothetical protein
MLQRRNLDIILTVIIILTAFLALAAQGAR